MGMSKKWYIIHGSMFLVLLCFGFVTGYQANEWKRFYGAVCLVILGSFACFYFFLEVLPRNVRSEGSEFMQITQYLLTAIVGGASFATAIILFYELY